MKTVRQAKTSEQNTMVLYLTNPWEPSFLITNKQAGFNSHSKLVLG
jgi:hypothetical protein